MTHFLSSTSYYWSLDTILKCLFRRSCRSSVIMNLTSIHEDSGLIPALAQWVKDLALLWLWCRLAVVALIRRLAWESPYAVGVALKSKNKTKP